jgi:RNase P subunit RPR2
MAFRVTRRLTVVRKEVAQAPDTLIMAVPEPSSRGIEDWICGKCRKPLASSVDPASLVAELSSNIRRVLFECTACSAFNEFRLSSA